VLYVGSADGSLYARDAATGAPLWSFPTAGPISSSPAVADGTVYSGSVDGRLYAFALPAPPAAAAERRPDPATL
jgi:outer membrane protein assembly factor BamB